VDRAGEVTLGHGVSSPDDALFRDELERLASQQGFTILVLTGHRRAVCAWQPQGIEGDHGEVLRRWSRTSLGATWWCAVRTAGPRPCDVRRALPAYAVATCARSSSAGEPSLRATLPGVTTPPHHAPGTRPTLEAVAARAGVSRATASRVLRGESNVSDEAREAVRTAAREISYTPNLAARSLVTGRSDSVAFLVDEGQERMFSEPFFLDMLRSAQVAVADAGLQLVFTMTSSSEDHERFLSYAAGGHVDGVLLMSLHGEDRLPLQLEKLGVPTVLSGRPLSRSRGRSLYYVDADNVGGARSATRHLLESGRRTVATVTGPQDMCAGQDRLVGYQRALHEAGVAYDERLVVDGQFSANGGYAAMLRVLEQRPEVDGVFAASDLAAIGAIRALEQSGRRVGRGPGEVSVVGFDDIRDAEGHRPPLTTVRQPIAELGTTMTVRLLERLAGATPPRATVLPVELVLRETG
jgi:DNA-binding LacI/PurR family transcriptional regulator